MTNKDNVSISIVQSIFEQLKEKAIEKAKENSGDDSPDSFEFEDLNSTVEVQEYDDDKGELTISIDNKLFNTWIMIKLDIDDMIRIMQTGIKRFNKAKSALEALA